MTINELKQKITAELLKEKCRGRWAAAVIEDSIQLLENLDNAGNIPATGKELEKILLNGAFEYRYKGTDKNRQDFLNWLVYSEGGCALIYNYDIAKHYCTMSEFKKVKEGFNNPNKYENWIELQARALYQASLKIHKAYEKIVACDPYLKQLRENKTLENARKAAAIIAAAV